MNRTGPRPIVFVCGGVANNGDFLMKTISATSPSEAMQFFTDEFGFKPKEVQGPFLKKRTQVIESTRVLKFTNQTKEAIYNDWIVSAIILSDPIDQAYLVFKKRVDETKATIPKGIITVPISDLRFI